MAWFSSGRITNPVADQVLVDTGPLAADVRTIQATLSATALGFYAFSGQTGVYGGLSAGAILFSARWGDATRLGIITAVRARVITTVVFTAAQRIDRDLMIVRSFTASDTGQTAVTLTGNNQKKRTSYGTSLFTDMRISGTGAIGAGTGTADAQAAGIIVGWAPASTGTNAGLGIAAEGDLLTDQGGARPSNRLGSKRRHSHPHSHCDGRGRLTDNLPNSSMGGSSSVLRGQNGDPASR